MAIKNFEEHTQELTDYEMKTVVPIFVRGLNLHIGKKNAITNNKITALIKNNHGIELKDTRVRKIIHYIRLNKLVPKLCATSNGYYIAASREEYAEWIESLKQRINSMQEIYNIALTDLT